MITTLSIYLAAYVGINQNRVTQYCYEAEYVNQYIEARQSGDDMAIEYAGYIMEEQERACKVFNNLYSNNN